MITWTFKKFDALTTHELYAILQLRNKVFAVEQNCVYADMDNKDQASDHLMAWKENALVAYTRIIPPGLIYTEPSIGRVVTSADIRRTGVGRELMDRSIEKTEELYGKTPIRIGAQVYLKNFYQSLGFKQTSDVYLEDGIEHIEMLR
jgi:ElaA protein